MSYEDGKKLKIFTGNANPELAREIADYLGLELGKAFVGKFNNGEIQVMIDESVRGKDVFVIQPTCQPANDTLMELLIMADALKRASAKHITAVVPYYGYARQDRKTRGREPITSKLVADLMTTAGITRVVTMDLHAGQIQGFFNIPVTHLTGLYLLGDYFKQKDFDWSQTVVVSPDMGRAKAAKKLSDYLGCEVAIAHKSRPKHNAAEVMGIIGDIKGKTCIINDDMIDTAGTLCANVKELKAMGAGDIYVCATHGIFSGPAIERLNDAPIVECLVTDAIPVEVGGKIKTISVAEEFAQAISAVYHEEPVSTLVGGDFAL